MKDVKYIGKRCIEVERNRDLRLKEKKRKDGKKKGGRDDREEERRMENKQL